MKENFRDIAMQAVTKEHQHKYREAGHLWNRALFLAKNNLNVDYCRCRADFCLNSHFTRKMINPG